MCMKNPIRTLPTLVNYLLSLAFRPLYLDTKNAIRAIFVDMNPFSSKWKRPLISRHVRYTMDVLKRDDVEIGEYTYGTPIVYAHQGSKLKIGKFCSIANEVTIFLGGEHRTELATTYPFYVFPDNWPESKHLRSGQVATVSKGDVIIGNDVWIGYGATILSGVRISDGAVIGAKAVITYDVEPYAIVAGNPNRLIRKRFDDATIRKLLELKWWDWSIEKIRENVNVICSNNIQELLQLL